MEPIPVISGWQREEKQTTNREGSIALLIKRISNIPGITVVALEVTPKEHDAMLSALTFIASQHPEDLSPQTNPPT